MTTAHTPTPWRIVVDIDTSIIGANDEIIADDTGYYPTAPSVKDMQHIVKCVNMHDELVEVLKIAKSELIVLHAAGVPVKSLGAVQSALINNDEASKKAGAL